MQYKREYLIDIVKGISIFLVVFGHFIQYSLTPNGIDFYNNPYFKVIYSFHMPLFIFISGYLIAYSVQKRSIYKNLVNKVNGLLVPYISWFVLAMVISIFTSIVKKNKDLSVVGFTKMMIDNLILYPYIWFLFTLFFIMFIFFLSVKLEKKIGISSYLITTMLVFMVPYNDKMDIYFIKWFYPFFVIGYLTKRYNNQIISKISKIKHVLFFVILISYIALMMHWGKNDFIYVNKMHFLSNDYFKEVMSYVYRYVVGLLGISLVFYISFYISRFKFVNSFSYIGLYTLDIYLIQRYIVETFYARIVNHLHLTINPNSILFVLLCLLGAIISVIICVAISNYILRKNIILCRLLLGNSLPQKNMNKKVTLKEVS